jgi:hypothetical protein
MSEERLVGAAIRIIGLWRIFYMGGNALYYVIAKDLGLKTTSTQPISVDLQNFVFECLLGTAIIFAAPAIVHLIYGRKPNAQP